ncbi:plasmid replication protein, CyRepA1 family [Microcystis aeruginosa]|uniref:plasmid replication protein, CyRepA1 family n=1 Tax=Microcystis aeruginosa TaxID=1126 RepID=UPI001D143153|nr:plasmid replication protein, CyRepA1 family [Microcystis aeruginosa]
MIKASHFQEWRSSAVDDEIIRLNVQSLERDESLERLTENAIEKIGSEQKTPHSYQYQTSPVARILDRYKDMSGEGWWASGINILTGEDSDWGCFKPDKPRISKEKGKAIKYEHPAKCPTEIFALRVPDHIWQKIGEKHGIAPYCPLPMGNPSTPPLISNLGNTPGVSFWQWVLENPSIALLITEGAKKAGALLSAGYLAIALPGIYNGYRQEKDSMGNVIGLPYLIPQLEPFSEGGREVVFAFDCDEKPKTIKNVRTAIERTGKLLTQKGCKVSVVSWFHMKEIAESIKKIDTSNLFDFARDDFGDDFFAPLNEFLNKPELFAWKGVDDFIASQGVGAFDRVYRERISLDEYKIANFSAITPDLTINERYISQSLNPPESAKIVAIKAPKGTGKTEWVASKIKEAKSRGQKVLIITHRVQLGRELSRRFGVNYRSELVNNEDGSLLGYCLCVDSLHGKANPRFNPNDWENTIIIIDECEQVFWHLINSPTCQKNRVKIIDAFGELLKTAIATGGKIYLSDADLSMNAIGYVQSKIGYRVESFIIENTYKPYKKRDLILFDSPAAVIEKAEKMASMGDKIIIHTDGQKHQSNWGSRTLELKIKKKYPNLKILRIDSESVVDPSHAAYGCMGNINEILPQYDIVICSPVIETGISIDVKHFDAVFAISHGVQTVDGFSQTLERVRSDVPRYAYIKEFSPNKIGNGSTDLKQLLAGEHFRDKYTIKSLLSLGLKEIPEFTYLEGDEKYSPSLSLWAKNAVKINLEGKKYQDAVLKKLKKEGIYDISWASDQDDDAIEAIKQEVKQAKNENYSEHKQAVLDAETITNAEFSALEEKEKRAITEKERNQLKRAKIERIYGINLTDDLITKHDDGWLPQIRLHYFLTVGNDFLVDRDKKKLDDSLENGGGKIFKPDMNKTLLSAKIQLLKGLNIEQFFDTEKEFTGDSLNEWLERLKKPAFVSQIKSILGFTLSMSDTPIAFAQRLLRALGLKLNYIGQRRREDGSRYRLYQGCDPLGDGRGEVFQEWLNRDELDHAKDEGYETMAA